MSPVIKAMELGSTKAGQRRIEKDRARQAHFALTVSDPQPVAEVARLWRTAAQSATIGMFVILSIIALSLARSILLPLVSAFVVTMMLGPLSARAERYRVPSLLSAIVLWLLVIGVCYGAISLLSAPAVNWIGKAPDIGRNIQEKLHVLDPLFFMLLGRSRIRRVLVAFFDERDARLRMLKIMNDIEHNLTGYLSTIALINIVVGICGGLAAWLAGLPDPAAWAVLGFILNFIPYIGALIMEASLFMVGLVTFPTVTHALLAPLLFLALATLEGHFITPSIMGRRLTLNPLTVFLSLVFWTWLWGPVGAFLAVPLLIMALVVVDHLFPEDEPELPA